jgi:hypothetical protein
MSKTKGPNILLIGLLAFLGYELVLKPSQESGGGETGFTNLLGGGGMPDMSGLFQGIGNLLGNIGGQAGGGISDFLAGLGLGGGLGGGEGGGGFNVNDFLAGLGLGGGNGGGIFGGNGGQGVAFDINRFLEGLGLGGGNGGGGTGGGGEGGGEYPPNMPNTIPNIVNALGYSAGELAKSAAIGAGTYLGFKVLQPVAPVAGRAIATGVKAISTPAIKVATSVASNLASTLMKPVSAVPKVGVAGAVLTAGAAGYGVGTLLMKYTPLGTVTGKAAESLGAKFGASEFGSKMFGAAQVAEKSKNVLSQWFTPAQIKAGITPEMLKKARGF